MNTGSGQVDDRNILVIAELVARPGSEQALRDLLVPFAQGSADEPGCLHYTLMEVRDEPGRFLTYEVWKDQDAADAHMRTPAIQAGIPQLVPLLAKPFTQIFSRALTKP